MLCPQCKRHFPDELVQPMFADGAYVTTCPICALAITRRIHEAPDYMFTGPIAKSMYDKAVAHIAELGETNALA